MLKFFLEDLNAEKPRGMMNMNTVHADSQGILVAATQVSPCIPLKKPLSDTP